MIDAEIKKFDDVSHLWWDKSGPFKALHLLNPIRFKFITKFSDIKDKEVLDVGCGGGILSEELAKNKAFVTGLDLSEESIKIADIHKEVSGLEINYINCSTKSLLSRGKKYDIICCFEMLEHVDDPKEIIKECLSLLKPNGSFYMSTLNRNLKSFVSLIVGAEYLLNMVPKGTHSYSKFIKPSEINNYLIQNKYVIKNISGIKYNFLYKNFYESSDVSTNYILHAQKI
jgi:2-polyprenyl-6-hydroxyphenyl methylase/3-demethylubiquinone-9 3-methyltransferase|tara:strand:- start:4471 stop:5154 length:684 start_codon:yes stop_codon:yes gene_type:complete